MDSFDAISIFLVDDDKGFLHTLEYHLQHRLKYSFKIKSFLSGEDCLNSLNQKPDIIVLDYLLDNNYPNPIDGNRVLEKIKQANPEIEVVMISGYEKVDAAIESLKHGAYDYIVKDDAFFHKLHITIRNLINAIGVRRKIKTNKRTVQVMMAIIVAVLLTLFVRWKLQ